MIKLFRNIRKTLVAEGKTTNYLKYAIGEIVLVVVGILIALSINNWNEKRIDKQKEQVFLNQLFNDFETNDSIIKVGLKQYQNTLKFINVILKHTGPKVNVPKDLAILDSLMGLNFPKIDLVYGSLNFSSQQIDLLKNQQLKVALSTFPSLYSSYKDQENQMKDLTINQRHVHQKYMSLLNYETDFKQEKFKSDTLGWLRDREFQNITVDKKWITGGTINEINKLKKQNQLIIDLIYKEVGRIKR